jgi:hypothetical protein
VPSFDDVVIMQSTLSLLVTLSAINGYGTYNFRVALASVLMGSFLTRVIYSQELQAGKAESGTHQY